MTIERILVAAFIADAAILGWLVWWLQRPVRSKRGGYVGNRWKR